METFKKCGHPKTPENIYWNKSRSGKAVSRCKRCRRRCEMEGREFEPTAAYRFLLSPETRARLEALEDR